MLDTMRQLRIDQIRKPGSDTTVGDPDHASRRGSGRTKINMWLETINMIIQNNSMTFIGCFKEYLAGTCAWLQPELQERRLFTVGGGRSVNQYLCDPQWFRDTANRGPTTIVAPESQFRTCPTDLYGPFNPYIPIRSTTIGKSRVAIDPIAMHTFWRSNSDIASVTRCVVPEKSNAIIGVVTTGFECLPPSCDGLTGSEDHGPMISPVDTPCGFEADCDDFPFDTLV
ncbi:exopolygalacturonase [Dorcoceras hygrometricum]|uniref:Exopolygalacturonase n=1 Tax=Dorcoceras hygrometricum TaxID=472368 RepID=A0A2Z7BAY6_9LAMI|nr:exopolygalacturonase [Dorcoceras hygrometricum]